VALFRYFVPLVGLLQGRNRLHNGQDRRDGGEDQSCDKSQEEGQRAGAMRVLKLVNSKICENRVRPTCIIAEDKNGGEENG